MYPNTLIIIDADTLPKFANKASWVTAIENQHATLTKYKHNIMVLISFVHTEKSSNRLKEWVCNNYQEYPVNIYFYKDNKLYSVKFNKQADGSVHHERAAVSTADNKPEIVFFNSKGNNQDIDALKSTYHVPRERCMFVTLDHHAAANTRFCATTISDDSVVSLTTEALLKKVMLENLRLPVSETQETRFSASKQNKQPLLAAAAASIQNHSSTRYHTFTSDDIAQSKGCGCCVIS